MFDNVLFVAPPVIPVTKADLHALEAAFGGIVFPPDYRQFLLEHGYGKLDGRTTIASPAQVIDETKKRRKWFKDLYQLYVEDPDFDPPLALDDIDRLIYIADDQAGDTFFYLPGDPPRFIEHPDGDYPNEQGTTFAEWIASLDPRERFYREATRTIRDGALIESAGLPDDIPWLFPFVPTGYEIPRLRVDDDRGLDLGRIVRVLEEVAHQDHQVLFSMSLEREDQLEVRLPMFNALLRGISRSKGVAVYVPVDRQSEALSWLTAQFTQRGYPSPL